MPTFIDESGNTGLTSNKGTLYFRMAAVWVPTHETAEDFRANIKKLRCRLGLKTKYEFKFAKTHLQPDIRRAFLEVARGFHFRFALSSFDKTIPENCDADGPHQHWSCSTELAALLRTTYHAAEANKEGHLREHVVVDDNRDGSFLRIIKEQFRALKSVKNPGSSMVGKVNFHDSASDEMLQLVDMICGAKGSLLDTGDDE